MTLLNINKIITEAKYTIIIETENTFEYINMDYINKDTDDFCFDFDRLTKYKNAKVFSIAVNSATGLLQVFCKA